MSQVVIDKLIFGGQGMGRANNKIVFVWGALPGEEVAFHILKSKKNFIEGLLDKVLTPAPERIEPIEPHYLCCSPWQTLAWPAENEWKRQIARETYRRVGGIEAPADLAIEHDDQQFGYRNKIEYSFIALPDGALSFAFHERGHHHGIAIDYCRLASDAINETAQKVLQWLRQQKITRAQVKSLIVRSNRAGETIAVLFMTDPAGLKHQPTRSGKWVGWQVYYSRPLSPAATPDELLHSDGQNFLSETVSGHNLKYGALSFFQVNVPLFERSLADISKHIPDGCALVDYYGGVGAISLPLHGKTKSITIIENSREAVNYAEENSKAYAKQQVIVKAEAAERETAHITSDSVVIVDPPRAGLHNAMIKRLVEMKPKRLVYLSCDLATQARDLQALAGTFQPIFWKLYNFFPRTPHIEGLVILDRV